MATVIVVGAGIIGSAIALELRQRGAEVRLIESTSQGGQTSSASAGMVNPFSLTLDDNPALPFALRSRAMFPQWVRTLRELTGIDAEWQESGSLRVALTHSDAEHLRHMEAWVQKYDPNARLLTPEEARQHEPALPETLTGALWLPSEGWVHTERLMRALHSALRTLGVEIYEGQPVLGFEISHHRVVGVRTYGGSLHADAVVLSAGAWTSALMQTLGFHIPIEPVRGQILVLGDLPKRLHLLLTSPIGYLVPRLNGTVLLGATREHAGFDMRPTAEGFAHLLHTLSRLCPTLMQATITGYTVGLRPATPDGNPLIGAVETLERLYLASGHAYHGILLAPATAVAVADLVLHHQTDLPIQPFNPQRYLRRE